MTRRNKVRLAVSWWKAIKTAEWHLFPHEARKSVDLYRRLFLRCVKQEFFSEGGIVPLTIVYEDFIQEYERIVRKILAFLALDRTNLDISAPALARTADTISEEWVQRFREELQGGWSHKG